ncbi:hypothetical protein EVG20_g526 [Dentipellis fragilis]|uniref:Uncharacterized protein n=1 Tax=Dentipellis fragilis TaxID=205917 RepID=A0A4Y9ZFD0_9AGAM|nr:hypothetical protein EVG20_g526 [Dentipellis fragilis]
MDPRDTSAGPAGGRHADRQAQGQARPGRRRPSRTWRVSNRTSDHPIAPRSVAAAPAPAAVLAPSRYPAPVPAVANQLRC